MSDGLQHWSHYTHFVLALVAVLDPFMAILVYLGTRGVLAGRLVND